MAVVLAAGFFVISSVGAAYLGMSMDAKGQMSNCPLMGIPALCHMSPLEHAFTLQNMLTALPFTGILAFLISVLLALSIIFLAPFAWINIGVLFEPLLRPPAVYKLISRHTLQEAFARGILHSKAF
jgi:hypothetical protein